MEENKIVPQTPKTPAVEEPTPAPAPSAEQLAKPALDVKPPVKDKKDTATKKSKKSGGNKKGVFVLFLAVMAVLGLVGIFVGYGRLSEKSAELKTLKNINIGSNTDSDRLNSQLLLAEDDYQAVKSYFPDDEGQVLFLNELDQMRSQGQIENYDITSAGIIKDAYAQGLAFTLQIKGDWTKIGDSLTKLQSLPYLTRTMMIEAVREGDSNEFTFRYGGIVYVEENAD